MEFTQVEARYSWIGVEGLPLNLWNMETFKKLGDACGGLMEVALETMIQSFLLFAKIKVKGFAIGFIHPIAEIPCENEHIHVGLFSIEGSSVSKEFRVGHNKGILARSLGESYLDILIGGGKERKKKVVIEEEKEDFALGGRERSLYAPVNDMVVEESSLGEDENRRVVIFPVTEFDGGNGGITAEEEEAVSRGVIMAQSKRNDTEGLQEHIFNSKDI